MLKVYLIEIKNRLKILLLSGVITMLMCYINKEIILFLCIKPTIITNSTHCSYFVTTNINEIFYVYLKISIGINYYVILLMSLYHGIIFLCPGLYKKELKKITELYKCSILLFLLSNCFFYYYVLPITWKFFFDFLPKISNLKITIQFEPKLQEYLDFFFGIYYIININLLLIIILISYLYQKKNILITLKNKKKLFIFLFFFLAAIVTPPDLFNQISTAFSIIIVYEIITIKIILEKILLTWKQIKTY